MQYTNETEINKLDELQNQNTDSKRVAKSIRIRKRRDETSRQALLSYYSTATHYGQLGLYL